MGTEGVIEVADDADSANEADRLAIIAELKQRVDDYGGLELFVRDHPDLDKRNVAKNLTKHLATLPMLLKYLRYLGVSPAEFFESADRRARE